MKAFDDQDKEDLRHELFNAERSWHILSRKATWKALEEAVGSAFDEAKRNGTIRKSDLRTAVSRHFIETVVRRSRKVRAATRKKLLLELERSKNSVLQQRNRAHQELEDLRTRVVELKANLQRGADEVLYPEEEQSFDREVRDKIAELHHRRMKTGLGISLDAKSVEELTAFVRDQRHRAIEMGLAHDREAMAVLERRVSKLTTTLDRAEAALRILAGKSGDHTAAAALFRDLQGFAPDSPMEKAKVEILRTLFEENLEFRREIAG